MMFGCCRLSWLIPMIDLPYRLRHAGWMLVLGSVLVFALGFLLWRISPWYTLQLSIFDTFAPPQLMAHNAIESSMQYQAPVLSSRQLQRRLLSYFSVHANKLSSDYEDEWLNVSLELKTQNLSLLASLPTWPGWQLQRLSLKPKNDYWSLQMRWQQAIYKAVTPVNPSGAVIDKRAVVTQAFDTHIWQLGTEEPVFVEQITGQLEAQVNSALPAMSNASVGWRYLGYVKGEQGLGGWLVNDAMGSDVSIYCFVRKGEKCGEVALVAITPRAVRLQHSDKIWRVQITKPWRVDDELAR